jgi:hypothetical protein
LFIAQDSSHFSARDATFGMARDSDTRSAACLL